MVLQKTVHGPIKGSYDSLPFPFCVLCEMELEDLPHILVPRCPTLRQRAASIMNFAKGLTSTDSDMYHAAHNIFKQFMSSKDDLEKVQFVLSKK